MGTTIAAMLEHRSEPEGPWFELCRWEFGKDYPLQILVTGLYRGWPPSACTEIEQMKRQGFIRHDERYWCELAFLPECDDARSVAYRVFKTAAETYQQQKPHEELRVLFWTS
jgi:hypothetical protein